MKYDGGALSWIFGRTWRYYIFINHVHPLLGGSVFDFLKDVEILYFLSMYYVPCLRLSGGLGDTIFLLFESLFPSCSQWSLTVLNSKFYIDSKDGLTLYIKAEDRYIFICNFFNSTLSRHLNNVSFVKDWASMCEILCLPGNSLYTNFKVIAQCP